MEPEVSLRVRVLRPPAHVAFRLQRGKDGLMPPSSAASDMLTFDFIARVSTRTESATPDLRGAFIHGRPGGRFLYLNSGTLAGQVDSCWTRRAKIPLTGLVWTQIQQAIDTPGAVLEVIVEGTAKDGGPACATVPLQEGGWTVKGA